MAKQDMERPIQQSLLDRLIDLDPLSKVEPMPTRAESIRDFKAGVRRDLEWLLNSRRTPEAPPEDMENAARSVLYFGISDLSSLSGDSSDDRVRLLHFIENAISNYEPRLSNVIVSEGDSTTIESRRVHFTIQATLTLNPGTELVFFDTVLDLGSKEYSVRGSS